MSEVKKNWMHKVVMSQLVLFAAAVLLMAGNKFSVLPFSIAFLGFGLSLLLAIILGVLGLLTLVFSLTPRFQSLRSNALKAAVVGVVPILLIFVVVGPSGFAAPAIHDITTNFEDPPSLSKAAELRSDQENSTVYDSETLIAIQKVAYPDLAPLMSELAPDAAYIRALQIAEQRGWEILVKNDELRIIEAIENTSFFGFTDDVVIRVSETSEGSRVDLRSSSRVGRGDFGANAKRIILFQKDFIAQSSQ